MMFGNNCQFDKEEIIEPKSKKATKKRKTTAMLLNEQNKRLSKLEKQLKDFCEKWEWLDIEDADKTLTESEQKIWELMKKNQELERQIAEKNKRIKKLNIEAQRYYEDAYCNDSQHVIQVLAKALELACANHPATCNDEANCNNEVDCVGCLVEHYKIQARKELKNEC